MRSLVGPMCGEDRADGGPDRGRDGRSRRPEGGHPLEDRRRLPTVRAALFQPEPFTAVLDTWVLFNQMADFFETGAGKEQLR